jgi:hypothetical protein
MQRFLRLPVVQTAVLADEIGVFRTRAQSGCAAVQPTPTSARIGDHDATLMIDGTRARQAGKESLVA